MTRPLWIWLLPAALAAACSAKDNPLYCDADTPCTDPARPFCDLDGAYPASDGIRNTCIATPGELPDGGPDASVVPGPDGAPTDAAIDATPIDAAWCQGDGDCTDEPSPICDTGDGMCRGCLTGPECETKDPTRPLCAPDGRCVACLDDTDDCPQPAAPICDLDDGVCRGCIPGASGDAECDGRSVLTPYCDDDGTCDECLVSGHCAPSSPICDSTGGFCRDCASSPECAARDAALPECRPGDGLCVECLTSDDCLGPTTPVCETGPGSCRACEADDECGSEICNELTGACVQSSVIVYVDAGGTDGAACGTQAAPCKTIGGATGGLPKVTGGRPFVKVRPGTYTEAVTVSGLTVTIVATGATINPPVDDTAALRVTAAAIVTVEGATLTGATGNDDSDGARCDNVGGKPQLTLSQVTITGNDGNGLDANHCTIRMDRSEVSANDSGGVVIVSSSFTLANNFIVENGRLTGPGSTFGGVSISNAALETPQILSFNTIGNNVARSTALSRGIVCDLPPPMTLTSNIVYAGSGGAAQVAGSCAWTYSDVEGAAALPGTGNLNTDPVFADEGTSDYHIQAGSPCRNAGNPAGGVLVDFDGDSRPSGGGYDIGADEVIP